MLQLTQAAAQSLSTLIEKKAQSAPSANQHTDSSDQQQPDYGMRISVSRGGCAGMQYSMKIAKQQDGDILVEGSHSDDSGNNSSYRVFIDPESVPFLKDCTLDYRYSLHDAGFIINNPQAARSCGCGTSFEPTPSSPDAASLPQGESNCTEEAPASSSNP